MVPKEKKRMQESTKLILVTIGVSAFVAVWVAIWLPTWLRAAGQAAAAVQNSYESARVEAGAHP